MRATGRHVAPKPGDTVDLMAPTAADIEPADGGDPDADGDLAEELARAGRKPWFNRTGLVLAGVVLAVGGFIGGIQVQKAYGTTNSTGGRGNALNAANGGSGRGGANGGNPAQRFGNGGNGSTGANGGNGGANRPTTGTIKLVDGNTIYIAVEGDDVVTVKLTDSTTVQTASKATVADLKAGATVTVAGQSGADGTVTATSVTQSK